MHRLLDRQLRKAQANGASAPEVLATLCGMVSSSYEEFERERRLNDRAAKLMEEELQAANARLRDESEAALSSAERRFLDALESGPGPLILLDADLNVLAWNSTSITVLGAASAQLVVGQPISRCARALIDQGAIKAPAGQEDAWVAFALDNIRAAGEPLEIRVEDRWFQQRPRRLSGGGYLNAWVDITELKQRERELALAKKAAESASQLKSQFLATMSHELRTPLNAILGFAEVIRDQVLGPAAVDRYASYAADIHRSGAHLLSLICDILDLSKIEAGSYRIAPERLDLGTEIDACVTMMCAAAAKGAVTVRFERPDPAISVDADHRALRQMVLNLLSNAVKFTPSGGTVAIATALDGDMLEVTVRDTGVGIAPDILPTLFEPFRQGDGSASRRYEGTGLGLCISRRLAELHGGTIMLESTLGEGTLATITLPLRQTAAGTASSVAA